MAIPAIGPFSRERVIAEPGREHIVIRQGLDEPDKFLLQNLPVWPFAFSPQITLNCVVWLIVRIQHRLQLIETDAL